MISTEMPKLIGNTYSDIDNLLDDTVVGYKIKFIPKYSEWNMIVYETNLIALERKIESIKELLCRVYNFNKQDDMTPELIPVYKK